MHNPGMINIPRSIPLPLQPYGRMPPPPAADFIPIDMGHHHHHHHQQQHHHHQPHVYLAHRQPSRYRTHQSFSGNQFYDGTERKRDSSNASRTNGASISVEGPAALDNRGDPEDDRTKIPKSTPWNPKGLTYTEGIIGLHEEIEAFVQWMVPTEAEHNLRLSVINRLRASIKEIYPEAVVQIFGSFRTGLYLPTSDIDLVLVGKWDQIPFEIVRRGIETKNLAKPGSLQLLEHATVPIIKMTDRLTDIKVDISFNMTNGLRSVELIKYFKKKFPAMAKLIYVLKQFLLQRDLNEVYTGGLSSYALILMVVSFLQLHPRGEEAGSDKANLGVLLIEFYELYGRHFNYTTTGIKISDGGSYVSKDEIRLKGIMTMGTGLGSLSIQDPYLPENDVGKSSYGIPVVKTAFEQAYLTLTKLVLPGGINYTNGESILSHVVRVSDEVITFRNWVASNSQGGEAAESAQSSSTTPPPASSTSASGPGKNDNNNEDQTLSEDPRLPTQITPTPSRDVLPRELPSKIFGGKDDQGGVEETTTAAPCVGKDTDNMSGVSTATSSESTTSQTDTVGRYYYNATILQQTQMPFWQMPPMVPYTNVPLLTPTGIPVWNVPQPHFVTSNFDQAASTSRNFTPREPRTEKKAKNIPRTDKHANDSVAKSHSGRTHKTAARNPDTAGKPTEMVGNQWSQNIAQADTEARNTSTKTRSSCRLAKRS